MPSQGAAPEKGGGMWPLPKAKEQPLLYRLGAGPSAVRLSLIYQ